MGIEIVTVEVGGQTFTAWEKIEVGAAFDEACRTFRLTAAMELGASETHATFAEGTPIRILANGDLLLDGYVDCRDAVLDEDNAALAVSGRSKSCDLIDCSAVHDTGHFENMTPDEIGNAVAQGIGSSFETDQQLDKVERYHLSQGKTIFNTVEELCRQQDMTLTGTAEGNILITKAGTGRMAGGFFEGQNIKWARAVHNASNRHSEYVVRGQRPRGHGADALEIEAKAKDSTVRRHRPRILLQKEDTTKARTRSRAANRRDRSAGHALKCEVTAQGFRDEAGALYVPGKLIWVESATLDIAQDMTIESVSYAQDHKGGSTAGLCLVDPRAYGGDKGKGNRSGDDYDMDDSEAE